VARAAQTQTSAALPTALYRQGLGEFFLDDLRVLPAAHEKVF
jgi:hypothetical protein